MELTVDFNNLWFVSNLAINPWIRWIRNWALYLTYFLNSVLSTTINESSINNALLFKSLVRAVFYWLISLIDVV
jgi:hypothetical protein